MKQNLPRLLFCIDLEKVFDSLDWTFVFKVMRTFEFANSVCGWIETFRRRLIVRHVNSPRSNSPTCLYSDVSIV